MRSLLLRVRGKPPGHFGRPTEVLFPANAIDEVLVLLHQRLSNAYVGRDNVAVAIGDWTGGEVIDGGSMHHALVVNPNRLLIGHVVINRHLLTADNGDAPNFGRAQPTDGDHGCDVGVRVMKMKIGHVLDRRVRVAGRPCLY